jgi:hypothetical protein
MSDLVSLLGSMRRAPRLPGAACRGKWALFDPAEPTETADETRNRHQAALAACQSCPALAECKQWIESLKPRHRPLGVVAGRINEPKKRRAA